MSTDNTIHSETVRYKTPRSALTTYRYNNEDLVKKCIDYANPLLEIRPKLNKKMFGKACYQNRNVGFLSDFSEGYLYSNTLMRAIPLNEDLIELLKVMNDYFGTSYNGVLINYYKDGYDHVMHHSDDESALEQNGVVAISYGASRIFRLYDKVSKRKLFDIPTESMQIIHMSKYFQEDVEHGIPEQKRVKDGRWSLTFRYHLK